MFICQIKREMEEEEREIIFGSSECLLNWLKKKTDYILKIPTNTKNVYNKLHKKLFSSKKKKTSK